VCGAHFQDNHISLSSAAMFVITVLYKKPSVGAHQITEQHFVELGVTVLSIDTGRMCKSWEACATQTMVITRTTIYARKWKGKTIKVFQAPDLVHYGGIRGVCSKTGSLRVSTRLLCGRSMMIADA
jgi:hypothetical protein